MGIVELKNDKIAIKVNTHGAELVSLKSIETDREYMWCGDAEYWEEFLLCCFHLWESSKDSVTDITGWFMRIYLSTDLQGTASL